MTNRTTPTTRTKSIQSVDRELQRIAENLRVARAHDLKELVDFWSVKVDCLLDEKLEHRAKPLRERLLAARDD